MVVSKKRSLDVVESIFGRDTCLRQGIPSAVTASSALLVWLFSECVMRTEEDGMPVLEVREVSKSFDAVRAVCGVSFSAQRGEILGFLGPNGAGKIIGLGLAGLIQGIAWATIAYFAARRFIPITLSVLSPAQLVSYPLYFILGYLLIATLYATAASTMKDVHSSGAQGMVYLLARFAAKVFEVGMLMYGKSANLREIWKWGIHSSRT